MTAQAKATAKEQEFPEAMTTKARAEGGEKGRKQTYLTESPPMILDATCSFSKIWPAHATIRMDIRPEVKPDLVGDICETDFQDATFDEVYLDPPHLFRRGGLETIKQLRRIKYHRFSVDPFTRYGTWKSREEWLEFAERSIKEVHRILKPTGQLRYKLTYSQDGKMNEQDFLKFGLFEVIKRETTKSISNFSKKHATVVWLTLRPRARPPAPAPSEAEA